MIVIPDLIRDPTFLHPFAVEEGRPRLKAGVTLKGFSSPAGSRA
jgi:hypothetical protein